MLDRSFHLKDKRVAVLGLGQTGRSCVDFLVAQEAKVLALDSSGDWRGKLPADVDLQLGDFKHANLSECDLIVLSPGVSRRHSALARAEQLDIPIVGDIELFGWFNPLPVVAITGSNGKSTVTEMVAEMLRESGLTPLVGGNIGIPALSLLNKPGDVVVLELSSFQLESTFLLAPIAATVLNLSADHMDRYETLAEYRAAKLRIYQHAKYSLYNRSDRGTWSSIIPSSTFGLDSVDDGWGYDPEVNALTLDGVTYMSLTGLDLHGHQILNAQAASALARMAGADDESIKHVVRTFSALPHRLETVAEHGGVRFVNDSKATNVGAVLAAIDAMACEKGQLVLLVGGDAKGAKLDALADVIPQLKAVIAYGKDADKFCQLSEQVIKVATLEDAYNAARDSLTSGDTLLLSPACASKDAYTSFAKRGQHFRELVQQWIAQEGSQ